VDVVVIGTLYSDFKFPWFDGWNERGTFRWNMFSEARREP
jgi:hypothetical protein